MTRYCRGCDTTKPHDEFDPNGYCRRCCASGKGPQFVRVSLPPGWSSSHKGLPEMRVPTQGEVDAGYEGDVWGAKKLTWEIEVRWRGDLGKYLCRTVKDGDEESPRETCALDYPHEVTEWMGRWFAQLANAKF